MQYIDSSSAGLRTYVEVNAIFPKFNRLHMQYLMSCELMAKGFRIRTEVDRRVYNQMQMEWLPDCRYSWTDFRHRVYHI
jgi:hypothetical protein